MEIIRGGLRGVYDGKFAILVDPYKKERSIQRAKGRGSVKEKMSGDPDRPGQYDGKGSTTDNKKSEPQDLKHWKRMCSNEAKRRTPQITPEQAEEYRIICGNMCEARKEREEKEAGYVKKQEAMKLQREGKRRRHGNDKMR